MGAQMFARGGHQMDQLNESEVARSIGIGLIVFAIAFNLPYA